MEATTLLETLRNQVMESGKNYLTLEVPEEQKEMYWNVLIMLSKREDFIIYANRDMSKVTISR